MQVCFKCVTESYLKAHILDTGNQSTCSYCTVDRPCIQTEELAEMIERAFREHYERTSDTPEAWEYAMLSDRDLDYEWQRDGELAEWAIAEAAGLDEEIAKDLQQILEERHADFELQAMGEECPFSEDSHYQRAALGAGDFYSKWHNFQNDLKTAARFFSPNAQSILDEIFEGIRDLKTSGDSPVIVKVGPTTEITKLYRARVFANEREQLKEALEHPWNHLGSPPSSIAKAGRMNARGISVFYGALEEHTALTEVRPPVGSKVTVAQFKITRSLHLLDLSALQMINTQGSIFDPESIKLQERGNFLSILSQLLSRAVMPHEEAIEYLPTQAVAEYLASHVHLDGILYPSIQEDGDAMNVVLFHHASRVAEDKLPKGSTIDSQLTTEDSDGVHDDYRIWVTPPKEPTDKQDTMLSSPWELALTNLDEICGNYDHREVSLRINNDSIQVHHIRKVSITADAHAVVRHQL